VGFAITSFNPAAVFGSGAGANTAIAVSEGPALALPVLGEIFDFVATVYLAYQLASALDAQVQANAASAVQQDAVEGSDEDAVDAPPTSVTAGSKEVDMPSLVGAPTSDGVDGKTDDYHTAAKTDEAKQLTEDTGTAFVLTGQGDGIDKIIVQAPVTEFGQEGIYEYIVTPNGTITHAMFRPGGAVTGNWGGL